MSIAISKIIAINVLNIIAFDGNIRIKRLIKKGKMIPMYVDYSLIGAKIKARRRETKMTQEKLAEALSVSVGYVSQVERGVTKISLELLARIGAALDCDMTRFLSDSAVSDSGYLKSELMEKYDGLTAVQKRMLLGILDVMLKEGNASL